MYKLQKIPQVVAPVKQQVVSRVSAGLTNAFYTVQYQAQTYLPFIVSILSPFK